MTFLQRGRWADDEARGFKWNHPQSQLWQDRDEGSSGDEKISKTKNYELQRRRRFIRRVKRLWGTRIKGTWMEGDGAHFFVYVCLASFYQNYKCMWPLDLEASAWHRGSIEGESLRLRIQPEDIPTLVSSECQNQHFPCSCKKSASAQVSVCSSRQRYRGDQRGCVGGGKKKETKETPPRHQTGNSSQEGAW